MVVGLGFEPRKASPTDLQSAPFDRSGTPPFCVKRIALFHISAFMSSYKKEIPKSYI